MKPKRAAMLFTALVLGAPIALAAPRFAFDANPSMNLMRSGENISLAADARYKLVLKIVMGARAQFSYRTTDAAALYAFYDHALKGEGWKDAPMVGANKMAATAMTGSADKAAAGSADKTTMMGANKTTMMGSDKSTTGADKMAGDAMAKPMNQVDAMTAMTGMRRADGSYSGEYAMNMLRLSLKTVTKGALTTVTFSLK